MKNNAAIIFGILLVVVVVLLKTALFIVPEGQQAIVTQFGRPIGDAKKDAGLYAKLPWQDVRYLEKRILNWDGNPNQVPTKDKKYIIVDTTARWRISDPLMFIRVVQNENRAESRISAVVDSATRLIISSHNLVEGVRNSNQILDDVERRRVEREKALAEGKMTQVAEEEVTGEIAMVSVGREQLSGKILRDAKIKLAEFGIELIDVQLRRISYEGSVEEKVFERMVSERQRIAEKIRSVGKGEQAKIFGKTDRDLQEIQSAAYKTVQEIKGKAEAESFKIYAESLKKDPDFFEFTRTLEAYRSGLRNDSRMILSSESKFLELLTEGK